MMTTVQARVDDQLKTQAERVLKSIGLDSSAAIRMFLAAVVNEQGLPFQAKVRPAVIDGMPLDLTRDELLEAMDDARLGRSLHGPYASAAEAMSAMATLADE